MQIDELYGVFNGVRRAVDLCGAPGSWSQLCRQRVGEGDGARVVSVDLQEVAPIDGVHHIVGDITKPETLSNILAALNGTAQLS
jgi:tRNA (cytidine32/guanosine34-2'-O)-methyltransferase